MICSKIFGVVIHFYKYNVKLKNLEVTWHNIIYYIILYHSIVIKTIAIFIYNMQTRV